jgi:threonine dehydrogenase-like Zn-dependent dehydrogenase
MKLAFHRASDLDRTLREGDRVLVLGPGEAAVAAAAAVGMSGRVTLVAGDAGEREEAERLCRRDGWYQVATAAAPGSGRLPAAAGSADAVVVTAPGAPGRPRAVLLPEVARVLRAGGTLVVLGAAGG